MPSARWLKSKIAAVSVVVAAIAVFVGNVDTIVGTVGGWFGSKEQPPAQAPIYQITPEALLEFARQYEKTSQTAEGPAKAEAAEAAKDLTQAAQALTQPVALNEGANPQPPWLKIAMAEVGQQEVAGEGHNPRIIDYIRSVDPSMADQGDEFPWSSVFVNWVMTQAGIGGTNSAAGKSWLDWGVPLQEPRLGAIAVFSRGPGAQPGFFLSEAGEFILCVSGNIGNAVGIQAMPKARLLGYRWPAS